MMDSDDDYSSSSSSLAMESIQDDSIANVSCSLRKSPRNSGQNNPKTDSTKPVTIPDNLRSLVQKQKHISKLLHGHDLDDNVSLRVLSAAMSMQGSYLRKLNKAGKGKKKSQKTQNSRDHLQPIEDQP
jgi:hypothetical protein